MISFFSNSRLAAIAMHNSLDFYDIVLSIAVAIVALTAHEFAHAWVAYKSGDNTAKMQGRLTLNPLAHIDIVGFLAFVFVGFGFARPVPINPNNFRNRKKGVFAVSIAGVTVNFALAIIGVFLWTLFNFVASKGSIDGNVYMVIVDFLSLFVVMNMVLVFFNLLPIFPLDGFRVVEAFANYNNSYTKFMRSYGQYILICLLLISVFVSSVDAMPSYFDILGTYLNFFALNTINFLSSIFNLIFYGSWYFVFWRPF